MWSQTWRAVGADNYLRMSAETLARSLADFLAEGRDTVAIEGGQVMFDFATAKYAVKAENGRCVLHLWSEERNAVRRVLDSEAKLWARAKDESVVC